MLGQAKQRWLQLCEQAAAEQNPQKTVGVCCGDQASFGGEEDSPRRHVWQVILREKSGIQSYPLKLGRGEVFGSIDWRIPRKRGAVSFGRGEITAAWRVSHNERGRHVGNNLFNVPG